MSDRGVQGEDVLQIQESCLVGEVHGGGREIIEATGAAGVLGHRDQQPTGAQQLGAAGQDLCDPGAPALAAGAAEVGWVAGVVEGVFGAQWLAGPPGWLVDHPGVTGIGWGGDQQVNSPGEIGQQRRQPASVAHPNLGQGDLVGGEGVGEVGTGQSSPAWFQLDPDRSAAEGGRLDQGGANAAHGVDDQPARWAVLDNQPPGQLGQHLARVTAGGTQVAPGALILGAGLGTRPNRQRHQLRRIEGGDRSWDGDGWWHGGPHVLHGCAEQVLLSLDPPRRVCGAGWGRD